MESRSVTGECVLNGCRVFCWVDENVLALERDGVCMAL